MTFGDLHRRMAQHDGDLIDGDARQQRSTAKVSGKRCGWAPSIRACLNTCSKRHRQLSVAGVISLSPDQKQCFQVVEDQVVGIQ